MKIAHVSNLAMGGIGRFVTDLSNVQSGSHTVCIISPLQGENYFKAALPPSVNYIQGNLASGFSLNLVEYYRISRVLDECDIVHFHAFNPILLVFCLARGKKILYTEHGTFNYANQKDSIKNLVKKFILGRFLLRFIPDAIVFNSRWMQLNCGLKNRLSVVIHNGIVIDNAHSPDRPKGTCKLLYVGRIEKKKRLDRLIGTLALAKDLHFHFYIIGSGSGADATRQLASDTLPEGCATFLGRRNDVDLYYQQAEMLLLGSVGEPFGLVVLEAIVNGALPLMYADAGGAIEIVEGCHENLVAATDQDMADNICFWHNSPEERTRVVHILQQRVVERFSVSIMAGHYQDLYQKLTH